jgi:hypothetical protein
MDVLHQEVLDLELDQLVYGYCSLADHVSQADTGEVLPHLEVDANPQSSS